MTGRPFSFVNETIEEAYASRAVFDAPDWMVDAWVSTYTAIAAGEMDGVTGDVEKVSGSPAAEPGTTAEQLNDGLAAASEYAGPGPDIRADSGSER